MGEATLGFRDPITLNKAPVVLSLTVINRVLLIEQLIRERRNAELHQLVFDMMRDK